MEGFNDIKGIFFDIGYTLCKPKNGNWRLTDKFYEYIKYDVFMNVSEQRIIDALKKSSKYLDENHLLSSLDEEYQQNIIAYSIIAKELPELGLSRYSIENIAYDRTYNMDN